MEIITPPPGEKTLAFMSSVGLFREIDSRQLELIAPNLEWFGLEKDEIFIHQGRPAGSMYLIYEGSVEIFQRGPGETEAVVSRRGSTETVGELAIIAGDRREASVRASSPATVARFARNTLVRLCISEPSLFDSLTEAVRTFQRESKLAELLSTGEMFSKLSESARQDLRQELEWIILTSGDEFIHQGDIGDFLGVVVSGQLGVYITDEDGRVLSVGRLGKGSVVGEMSLFTGDPRTATVRATRDSEVVKLSQDGFHQLLEKHPIEITKAFASSIIEKLWREASFKSKPLDEIATLAVVPVSPEVPADEFCKRLVQALSKSGTTRHLNSQIVDQVLEMEGISQTPGQGINEERLVAWLNTQEHLNEYVLYQADASFSNWSKRSLRQADAVLIVGKGDALPDKGELEQILFTDEFTWKQLRKALVVLHDETVLQPNGTIQWLKIRPEIETHYHVRASNDSDYQRLARHLTGQAVGVVLSGGGARGAAHIGVIRALQEAGVPIDHIGGNSAGAAIAAIFALGRTIAELPDLIKLAFKPSNFFDPTIPLYSMTSGRRGAKYYREMLGDIDIEDLWLPFYCVSANLTRAELMVHDHGPLWQAVLASNSAPGIRPPVVQDGDLLIDGGLLDDLPIDVMREKVGGGTVIAVDVSPSVDLAENPDYGASLNGLEIIWSRINPFVEPLRLPPITALLQRANQLSSIRAQRDLMRAKLADLHIRPPVDTFSMMDYRAIDAMVAVAYEATKEQIAQWRGGSKWKWPA